MIFMKGLVDYIVEKLNEYENIKDLTINDIRKIVSGFLKTGKIISVKDDGKKFIVELKDDKFDTELDKLSDYFGKTYNVDVGYDIETDSIEIYKKKFEPLSSLIKKFNDQDNIVSKKEQQAKEKEKHKVQSNGLTPHDEEMIDLAHSTTYRSDKNKYLKAVDTDKARKIIEYIFSDNDIKWED